MTAIRGMLTPDDLAGKVQSGVIDTVLAVFTDHYGRFMGKRFDAEFFVEDILRQGTHACDYLLTVDMEMEPVPGYAFANWERGYGDFHLLPDISTLRLASWLDRTALVVCDVENERAHKLVEQTPRTILRKQIERAAALGYTAMAATELEYYIYTDSYREAHRKGYAGLSAAGWYIEDYHALQGSREEFFNAEVRRHLKASGIPVENSKGEWGLGQHELNVRYADALTMADRHVIYKQCLKEVADSLGISVTFMAKIDEKQAGSSSHIHLSLWKDGQAAFAGDQPIGPVLGSDIFRWFLGGVDCPRTGTDALLRAHYQLLQALPGRFLGTDAAGLEPRQPHRGLSGGGPGQESAHREPHPRRGCQPLSGPGRGPGLRAGRHRKAHGAPAHLPGGHLQRPTPAPGSSQPAGGHGQSGAEHLRR